MPRENLSSFLLRHRFKVWDLFSRAKGTSREDYEVIRRFPQNKIAFWPFGDGKLAELCRAFAVAEYMAAYQTNQPEEFAIYTSRLTDEGWNFALRFCPYHHVANALKNLDVIHSAMLDACLSLSSAMAGMGSAMEITSSKSGAYKRERSKATSSLLNFSALYASYIDICRRIRKYSDLGNASSYDRAIARILKRSIGEHGFIRGLRNFILHYEIVEPFTSVTLDENRITKLLLNSSSLLEAGFQWKEDARSFIQSSKDIDLIHTTSVIVGDVRRLIKFHQNIADRYQKTEKTAYETYVYERLRQHHLKRAISDLGAVFKRPTPLLTRLLDEGVVKQTLESALSDDDVRTILCLLANKHRNLEPAAEQAVAREVDKLLLKRPRFPYAGSYVNGRRFP